jgi:hypothetical protein
MREHDLTHALTEIIRSEKDNCRKIAEMNKQPYKEVSDEEIKDFYIKKYGVDGWNKIITREQARIISRETLERAEKERLQIADQEASKGNNDLAFICACCGAIGYCACESIDSGTTLTCDSCGGKTVVLLQTTEEYQKYFKWLQEAK